MNKLVKAEWYRVKYSSNLMKWIIFVCVFLALLPVLANWEIKGGTASDYMIGLEEVAIIYIPLCVTVMSAVIVSLGYIQKTAYYEVMAGAKTSHILFSKLLVHAILITVLLVCSHLVCLLILGNKHGMGQLEQIEWRLLLYALAVFHYACCGVLIATALRQGGAIVIAMIYFNMLMLISYVTISVLEIKGNISSEILAECMKWFSTMNQLGNICVGELNHRLVIAVIGSFLLDSGLWYAISYIGMKKKVYR